MSRFWRTFFGAAVGALLVLLIHPVSRPFLLTALSKWGSSKTFQIIEDQTELPVPASLADASVWMQEAAQRIRQPDAIQSHEWKSFFSVAQHAAQQDADNAFWVQMQAAMSNALSKTLPPSKRAQLHAAVLEDWAKAAHLSRWDDYQTRRLKSIQAKLAREAGGNAAWQFAAVYPLHLTYTAEAIDDLARELLRNLDSNSQSALELRYETLMNGKLMREGSRSIAVGEIGAKLVEVASYPKEIAPDPNPRTLVLTRTEFFNRLVAAHMIDQAQQVMEAFKSNEAWLAFMQQENVGTETEELRVASLLTIDLPGALLATSLVGALLWAMSTLLRAAPWLMKVFEAPYALVIGAALAILVFSVTRLPLAALAVFACLGFMALTPRNERSQAAEPLGSVFEVIQFLLGCVLAVLLIGFLIGLSTPGCQVLQELDVPKEFYGGSTLLLGLAGIVIALLSLSAPCWAIVQRIAKSSVLVASLRQFGRGLFLACLALAILVTPICVIADHFVQSRLDKIIANEPVYYLPT